jgi:transcriptional regulator with XRE-family HTH domain
MVREQTTYSAVLGVVLSNLRAEKDVDQGVLANRMGLSQASYSRLESGKATFSLDQMYQAADALELTGEEICNRVNNMVAVLNKSGTKVIPQVRSNTRQAKSKEPDSKAGAVLAGAALGALIVALVNRK